MEKSVNIILEETQLNELLNNSIKDKQLGKIDSISILQKSSRFKNYSNIDFLVISNYKCIMFLENIDIKFKIIITQDAYVNFKSEIYEYRLKLTKIIDKLNIIIQEKNQTIEEIIKIELLKNIKNRDIVFISTMLEENVINQKPTITLPKHKNIKHILIIGNDPYLTEFSEKYEKIIQNLNDVETIGINRSFMKIKTKYISFLDLEIMDELVYHFSDIYTSDKFRWIKNLIPLYNKQFIKRRYNDYMYKIKIGTYVPEHWNINKRFSSTSNKFEQIWPGAISLNNCFRTVIPTLISTLFICKYQLFKEYDCHFYITCSAFKFNKLNQHHFWTQDDVKNKKLACADPEYITRLNRFLKDFKFKKEEFKFQITSIQKNSRLNEFCDYVEELDFFKNFASSI